MIYVENGYCPQCGAEAEVTYRGNSDVEEWDCPNCGQFTCYETDRD